MPWFHKSRALLEARGRVICIVGIDGIVSHHYYTLHYILYIK
jgi:hypothetical protein